jgi:hypothetical protein
LPAVCAVGEPAIRMCRPLEILVDFFVDFSAAWPGEDMPISNNPKTVVIFGYVDMIFVPPTCMRKETGFR